MSVLVRVKPAAASVGAGAAGDCAASRAVAATAAAASPAPVIPVRLMGPLLVRIDTGSGAVCSAAEVERNLFTRGCWNILPGNAREVTNRSIHTDHALRPRVLPALLLRCAHRGGDAPRNQGAGAPHRRAHRARGAAGAAHPGSRLRHRHAAHGAAAAAAARALRGTRERSEERRVGEECRSRWSPYH